MPDRPLCSHCGRRVSRSGHSGVLEANGAEFFYCTHKPACRRAQHERHGAVVRLAGASDEALGTALIAADYVSWPLWSRLLPRSWRDEVRSRFARVLASAVEHRARQAEAESRAAR